MPVAVTVGGGNTVSVSTAPGALGPADELTAPGLFDSVPGSAPPTDIEIVQLAKPANEPPDSENVDVPGVAVITPAEPQVPLSPFGSSIVRPAGSMSEN